MQLFISEYSKKNDTLLIENEGLLLQLRKVLRSSIGDTFFIQNPAEEEVKIRYEVKITRWDNKTIEGVIINELAHTQEKQQITMIIAMPNKWEKAELIVQKLSEIGISKIIFWPSERSIIKIWNSKKEERIYKIIKEATEQSRGRTLPKIEFTTDIAQHLTNTEVIVFDKQTTPPQASASASEETTITGIVGPEGGFTKKDYAIFAPYHPKTVSLGATVLRMETAAIIGGRLLKNTQ